MQTNELINPAAYHAAVTDQIRRTVDWSTKGLRITRLRLLSDPGHPAWDVSYCHGELDGEPVNVSVPFDRLPKGRVSRTIVQYGYATGVYVKGTGILDAISTLS